MKRTIISLTLGLLAGTVLAGRAAQAAEAVLSARPSTNRFYVDGQQVQLEAYVINDYNYIKLGNLSTKLGFDLTYDPATGNVYIGEAPQVSGPVLANGKAITEENVLELLRQIERDWPTGTVWGTHNTAGSRKNEVASSESGKILQSYHVSNVYGCGAYASMVSSLIFGDTTNPGRKLEDLTRIRPGDLILRVDNSTGRVNHVVIALETPDSQNRYNVTDGNHGGRIVWPEEGSPYSSMNNLDSYTGELAYQHLEVWTRYPESTAFTGNSVAAWRVTGEV